MGVILDVRPEWRAQLAAVTHVDGTARIQTVCRDTNPRYWELLRTFGDRTGVAVLLNTSLNNHAEPIVDSARDAVACFLTTDLQAMVIGDWLIRKRVASPDAWQELRVRLPDPVALSAVRGARGHNESGWIYQVRFACHHGRSAQISHSLYRLLADADGALSIGDFSRRTGQSTAQIEGLVSELRSLWSNRFVELDPPA